MDEDNRERASNGDLLATHLTLAATLTAFAFVAIRVLAIARLDQITALAILQASGPASVILGVVLASFEHIASWVAALAFLYDLRARSLDQHRFQARVVYVVTTCLAVIFGWWLWAILLLGLFFFSMGWLPFGQRSAKAMRQKMDQQLLAAREHQGELIERVSSLERDLEKQRPTPEISAPSGSRNHDAPRSGVSESFSSSLEKLKADVKAHSSYLEEMAREADERLTRVRNRNIGFVRNVGVWWGIGLSLSLLTSALLGRPWMPSEAVIVDSNRLVGYVLDEDAATLLVLKDEPREVERLNASEIQDRFFCDLTDRVSRWFTARLADLLLPSSASYPRCFPPEPADNPPGSPPTTRAGRFSSFDFEHSRA